MQTSCFGVNKISCVVLTEGSMAVNRGWKNYCLQGRNKTVSICETNCDSCKIFLMSAFMIAKDKDNIRSGISHVR